MNNTQNETTTQATPRILPKNTDAAIKEVMSTIKQLGEVYTEEAEALNNTDNKRFMKLQEKKVQVAKTYKSDMEQMIARKSEVKHADPATKDKLRKAQEEFAALSKKNMDAINRMQSATERLGNTIRSAAIRAAQKQSGYSYSETGTINNISKRKAVSTGLSETV